MLCCGIRVDTAAVLGWKQATQLDNPLRQATARVDVFVVDVNDNRPEFEYDMYNITVMENLPQGFTVLQVYAFDADKGENAEFRYVLEDPSQAFRIDDKSGWISVRDPTKLDRETQARIQMKVTAQEKRPHGNSSTSFTSVEINLLDANDNNPQVGTGASGDPGSQPGLPATRGGSQCRRGEAGALIVLRLLSLSSL